MKRSHKGLNVWASDRILRGVTFGLDVDTIEPKCVLVDDPVDSAVIGQLRTCGFRISSAVTHGNNQIDNRPLEGGWLALVQELD